MQRTLQLFVCTSVILLTGFFDVDATRAETALAGNRAHLRVAVTDASVDEVLAALGAKFGLTYRASAPLDRRLNGEFSGSLQRVVGGVLDGYNFVIRTEAEHVDVTILSLEKHQDAAMKPTRRRAD